MGTVLTCRTYFVEDGEIVECVRDGLNLQRDCIFAEREGHRAPSENRPRATE
jgi:hypothetical protein